MNKLLSSESVHTTEVKINSYRPAMHGLKDAYNFVLADIFLRNDEKLNLCRPKFARPLYFIFLIELLALPQR